MTELSANTLLWLALTRVPSIGRRRIKSLRERFGSVEAIWNAPEAALRELSIPKEAIQSLRKGPDVGRLRGLCESWRGRGIEILGCEDADYPEALNAIYDAPPVLFLTGKRELLKAPMMAVVGARKCTSYGSRAAYGIGRSLTDRGYAVVSGMASGIDSWGHKGALDAGGGTVAVLGCGVDICYPPDNQPLRSQIAERGLLLSEYPPGTPPRAVFFPERNRIISGLSLGVIVVEAGERSGSLITADQALEQGRDVYCVPGSIFAPMSRGTNRLIQQGGAMLLYRMEDIPAARETVPAVREDIPAVGETGPTVHEDTSSAHEDTSSARETVPAVREDTPPARETVCPGPADPPRQRTRPEEQVLRALAAEGRTANELRETSGLPMQELQQVLTVLEIEGMICQTPDHRWIRST